MLAPGGRALFTAYLWNAEARALVSQGKCIHAFEERGDLISADPVVPENSLAIGQEQFEAAVRDASLVIEGPVRWGSWCTRPDTLTTQDMVLVRKPA